MREKHTYEDLIGITKSLIRDQQNFVIHFKQMACFEMYNEYRDEILDIIQQVYWLKFN